MRLKAGEGVSFPAPPSQKAEDTSQCLLTHTQLTASITSFTIGLSSFTWLEYSRKLAREAKVTSNFIFHFKNFLSHLSEHYITQLTLISQI